MSGSGGLVEGLDHTGLSSIALPAPRVGDTTSRNSTAFTSDSFLSWPCFFFFLWGFGLRALGLVLSLLGVVVLSSRGHHNSVTN